MEADTRIVPPLPVRLLLSAAARACFGAFDIERGFKPATTVSAAELRAAEAELLAAAKALGHDPAVKGGTCPAL